MDPLDDPYCDEEGSEDPVMDVGVCSGPLNRYLGKVRTGILEGVRGGVGQKRRGDGPLRLLVFSLVLGEGTYLPGPRDSLVLLNWM